MIHGFKIVVQVEKIKIYLKIARSDLKKMECMVYRCRPTCPAVMAYAPSDK